MGWILRVPGWGSATWALPFAQEEELVPEAGWCHQCEVHGRWNSSPLFNHQSIFMRHGSFYDLYIFQLKTPDDPPESSQSHFFQIHNHTWECIRVPVPAAPSSSNSVTVAPWIHLHCNANACIKTKALWFWLPAFRPAVILSPQLASDRAIIFYSATHTSLF